MQHTVLVIDDQWSMQELARIVLRAAGYRVLLAGDNTMGASLAHTDHPDVIVLDTNMPGSDSLEVLQNLRLDAQTSDIPVILIAPAMQGELPPSLLSAVTHCLRKPFKASELLAAIDGILNHRPVSMAG